jgi:tRNA (guanine-N7-)-methyltransferase
MEEDLLEIRTFYEQQWLSRGLSIKYLRFICPKQQEWVEPEIEIEKDSYRSFGRNAKV